MDDVIFKFGTKQQYEELPTPRDENTLFWIEDTQECYKGDKLFGIGIPATQKSAGLLSAEDKQKIESLSAVPKTVLMGPDNVIISQQPNNGLVIKEDGLFANIATYSLKNEGDGRYVLYQTLDGKSTNVGEIDLSPILKGGN